MTKKISSYRDLEIWQEAMELVVEVYRLCNELPATENLGLKTQMKRAVVSVATNIAEGHSRASTGPYLLHLSIAYGSLGELETELLVCVALTYVAKSCVQPLLERTERIGKRTNALIESLKRRRAATGTARHQTEHYFPAP
jgi:four helix bundle protein